VPSWSLVACAFPWHRTAAAAPPLLLLLQAFGRLDTVADKLRISDSTLRRAKTFFAAFRDNREHVQK